MLSKCSRGFDKKNSHRECKDASQGSQFAGNKGTWEAVQRSLAVEQLPLPVACEPCHSVQPGHAPHHCTWTAAPAAAPPASSSCVPPPALPGPGHAAPRPGLRSPSPASACFCPGLLWPAEGSRGRWACLFLSLPLPLVYLIQGKGWREHRTSAELLGFQFPDSAIRSRNTSRSLINLLPCPALYGLSNFRTFPRKIWIPSSSLTTSCSVLCNPSTQEANPECEARVI